MAVSFNEVMKKFTPAQRARIEARAKELIEEELTLRDLRQAQNLTQERMAELLGVEQENVSRLERRADLLLSTLSSYVAAMGGKLRLVAEFPSRKPVTIMLSDLHNKDPRKPQSRSRGIKPRTTSGKASPINTARPPQKRKTQQARQTRALA
jgi:DNA-binding XRE family transcriptional regulator